METITASAIRWRRRDSDDWHVVTRRRHADCIKQFARRGLRRADRDPDETQGFVTDTGRFVDRYEAFRIALASGQLEDTCADRPDRKLYSEDLW